MNGIIRQFLKFAVIGVINTGVDFGILNLLVWITDTSKDDPKLIFLNIISFSIAVVNSYWLNKKWAFQDQGSGDTGKKFSKFLIVSIIGVAINTTVLKFISANVDPLFGLNDQLWINVAKIVATGISLIWNFIGYKLLVFRK
jgi:putative flippase GtrA